MSVPPTSAKHHNVCFGRIADFRSAPINFCFRPKTDIRIPFLWPINLLISTISDEYKSVAGCYLSVASFALNLNENRYGGGISSCQREARMPNCSAVIPRGCISRLNAAFSPMAARWIWKPMVSERGQWGIVEGLVVVRRNITAPDQHACDEGASSIG